AVDEHQGALAAETQEVHEVLAGTERAALGGPHRRSTGYPERRLLVKSVRHGLEPALLDRRAVDDHRRLESLEVRTLDARTGNRDFLLGRRSRRRRGVGALGV